MRVCSECVTEYLDLSEEERVKRFFNDSREEYDRIMQQSPRSRQHHVTALQFLTTISLSSPASGGATASATTDVHRRRKMAAMLGTVRVVE